MTKQWIFYALSAIGLVVVGLWIYRSVSPSQVVRVPSGGAGSQASAPGGFKLDGKSSTIAIGPATIKPSWDTNYVNKLTDYL